MEALPQSAHPPEVVPRETLQQPMQHANFKHY